ncbi:NDR1/HIN1-like protein 13 [Ipomoea triloba]|uniref:NDR1/HIN1-like protein 13 n=1 Tax=Ipomoea triloba TaxID=35885 RepID=UPI00125E0D5D|nr:NDR1/HIN1-like protein 13 [Ipomoea triloba]
MADRVYPGPASKPATNGADAAAGGGGGANPAFPATKAQLYNATRPVYRPQPSPRRHKRSFCCSCCLWTTFLVITLIILAAIAGGIFYVLYRPERPTFAVNSLHLSQFNLSATTLTSKLNISVSARNPNKKITYFYDPITISTFSGDIPVGTGSFPAFEHGTKNTTNLKATISTSKQTLDAGDISKLKSKKTLPLTLKLETKVKVKVGGLKTKKVGIRVTCDGIRVSVPAGKSLSKATTSNVDCKVDLRIKIWKWTL